MKHVLPKSKQHIFFILQNLPLGQTRPLLVKNSPLNICVVGKEETFNYLKQITNGRKVSGRNFKLTSYDTLPSTAQALACHAIYFGKLKKENSKAFVKNLQSKPILSISGPEEALPGTIVIFLEKNNKLGIQVDVGLAKRAKLFISAELLSLAKVVGG